MDVDTERILKLTALVTQGLLELQNILNNKKQQATHPDTKEGNLAIAEHAKKANDEARALIEAL